MAALFAGEEIWPTFLGFARFKVAKEFEWQNNDGVVMMLMRVRSRTRRREAVL